MSLIRNPKNKFGEMLFNIATNVILPEVIGTIGDTIIKNVMEPKKEERRYIPQNVNYRNIENSYKPTPVYQQQIPRDNNVNINLNISTKPEVNYVKPEPKVQKVENQYITPNIYVPMYME